jgi:hypothetical protein
MVNRLGDDIKEAKAEFNRFATAASRIQILINEITKVQEEA